MELIQIVDEYGNFTVEVVDKDYAHDHNLLHNEVAIFILILKEKLYYKKEAVINDIIQICGQYAQGMLLHMKV